MKFIVATVLIALLSFAIGMFLPWWCIALASFLVIYFINLRPLAAFLAGFSGIFICWLILALLRDTANDGILSTRIAALFGMPNAPVMLSIISALIGGLVGGLAALTASYTVSRRSYEA